ncbi:MAG: esterase/lipase family protein [Candidatus Hodarchaeales archaeon]|jgi:pimeloyl-ACP methyl ester carboxylesterase
MTDMSERSRFKRPRFVDITPETERLKELDHFWIIMDHCRELGLWRFSYVSEDETGEYIPKGPSARFNEPILMMHGYGTSHTMFNWFARELWYAGFRFLFALDCNESSELLEASKRLEKVINEIREITNAERISIIAHSTGGIIARYYTKFTIGADRHLRILAMIGTPHDKTQYLKYLKTTKMEKSDIVKTLDYLEDINSTLTEKELYHLTQINVGGSPWTYKSRLGEKLRFIPISDAINIVISSTHLRVHKHKATLATLRHLLVPNVAVFKIRLLAIQNIRSHLVFRIHYRGHMTQIYPQRGVIHIPSEIESQNNQPKLTVYLFSKQRIKQKKIGKLEIEIDYKELPNIQYASLEGKSNERVDLAIYSYIP